MVEAPASIAVPLSRSLAGETPGHSTHYRDSGNTADGTLGLKALAQLVIARDNRRDTTRDSVSRLVSDTRLHSETAGTPDGSGGWAERAAIVEYDGAVPRDWAEGFARLNPDRPPGDVSAARWRRYVDDVGQFIDRWAGHAAALGWGPLDLFGCDRDRPFARLDQNGLLWLLNGGHLVALTEDAAVMEDHAGVRQTWRRRPSKWDRVLAWELASL